MKLIVAGGGTGGHVLAGIAVADAWKSRYGAGASAVFVGAEGGIEERLVPKSGYPLELLRLGALNRVSMGQRIKTLLRLPFSMLRSCSLILKHRPDAVLGVGGYASGPLVFMARILRILHFTGARTAILEQNTVPGFTNRMLARLVETVFCAFPGTERRFNGKPVAVTGNPVRSAMTLLPSASRDPFTIFIFGGSQGALGINTLVIDALPFLKGQRLKFIHQTGERDFERVKKAHEAAGTDARVEKFIYEMPAAYREASLLICRSGSGTLAEIAAVGRASVLIPLPTASDNHQEVNARVFTDAGAAALLLQNKSKGEDLAKLIEQLVAAPERISKMEKEVTAFYKPKAAEDIVSALSKAAP